MATDPPRDHPAPGRDGARVVRGGRLGLLDARLVDRLDGGRRPRIGAGEHPVHVPGDDDDAVPVQCHPGHDDDQAPRVAAGQDHGEADRPFAGQVEGPVAQLGHRRRGHRIHLLGGRLVAGDDRLTGVGHHLPQARTVDDEGCAQRLEPVQHRAYGVQHVGHVEAVDR
jgi:hypothetical protein